MSTAGKAVCVVYLAYIVKLSLHKQALFWTHQEMVEISTLLSTSHHITSHVYEMRIDHKNLNQYLNF